MSGNTPLSGATVLITRPEPGAERLAERLLSLGAVPLRAPMIEICANPLVSDKPITQAQFNAYSGVVFISRNAVTFGYPLLAQFDLAAKTLFAVGNATAAELAEAFPGTEPNICVPQSNFSSAGLLKLDNFQARRVGQKRFLIVRGVGGRELLANTIRSRGGYVDYLEAYIRRPTAVNIAQLLENHRINKPSIGVVTSVEGGINLASKLAAEGLMSLFAMPLLTVSKRVADALSRGGFTYPPLIADNPSIDSIVHRLTRWAEEP